MNDPSRLSNAARVGIPLPWVVAVGAAAMSLGGVIATVIALKSGLHSHQESYGHEKIRTEFEQVVERLTRLEADMEHIETLLLRVLDGEGRE
jgi:hypothetical protein